MAYKLLIIILVFLAVVPKIQMFKELDYDFHPMLHNMEYIERDVRSFRCTNPKQHSEKRCRDHCRHKQHKTGRCIPKKSGTFCHCIESVRPKSI
ncbi:unnamed protein product [Adineta ricciae]|uniref:Uncharacterized protein n=1 Tax=Adineta ricciae TaxID=249248 RepID=A0A814HWB2_ADIRI|nr:unnamed protein product [Adineta ricciae]